MLPIAPIPGDGGFIVSVADRVLAEVAVIVDDVLPATANVVTVNVPLVWPAAIKRLVGTFAAG